MFSFLYFFGCTNRHIDEELEYPMEEPIPLNVFLYDYESEMMVGSVQKISYYTSHEPMNISFSTLDNTIADVDQNGMIEAIGEGSVIIHLQIAFEEGTKDFNIHLTVIGEEEVISWEIQYILNGGTAQNLVLSCLSNETVLLPDAIKARHTFLGWSLSMDQISYVNQLENVNHH